MPVLKVDVVTAEERLYEGNAKFVVIPGTEGELGILPGHERLLTRMRPGSVRVTQENNEEVILFVAGGFVDVQPEQVIVLADTAVRAHDLDEAKAQQARKAAEELMQNSQSKFDYARAQAELGRSRRATGRHRAFAQAPPLRLGHHKKGAMLPCTTTALTCRPTTGGVKNRAGSPF